jgi:hypothetical protein
MLTSLDAPTRAIAPIAIDAGVTVDPYRVPESMTFAHSTRMADSWRPTPERIMQPAMQVGPASVHVDVFEGSTAELDIARWRTRHPIKRLKRARTVELRGAFVYDTRYEIDSNVGHYVVDTVPKILAARAAIAECLGADVEVHAILREGTSRMSTEVFQAFGIPTLATEAKVVAKLVRITENRPETFVDGQLQHSGAPLMAGNLAGIYSAFRATLALPGPATPEKIFVSRRDSRTIENEAEVERILEARGFRKYLFETGELSLLDQWRVMAGAREIVAIHGAGLTPLIFNSRGLARAPNDLGGLRVVELYGAGYFVDFNRRLAAVVNAHWCGVRGRISPEIVRDLDERGGGRLHQSSPFRVDPETLELALAYSDRCGNANLETRAN